jgi:hypothetical protein
MFESRAARGEHVGDAVQHGPAVPGERARHLEDVVLPEAPHRATLGERDVHVEEGGVEPVALLVSDVPARCAANRADVGPAEVAEVLEQRGLREVHESGVGHSDLELVVEDSPRREPHAGADDASRLRLRRGPDRPRQILGVAGDEGDDVLDRPEVEPYVVEDVDAQPLLDPLPKHDESERVDAVGGDPLPRFDGALVELRHLGDDPLDLDPDIGLGPAHGNLTETGLAGTPTTIA